MRENDGGTSDTTSHSEPRPRVPIPPWMRSWPRGVQPTALRANRRGVEFLYRAPQDRWFRVETSLEQRRPSGISVRGLPGVDAVMLERLTKAVELRLLRSPPARVWLSRARTFVETLGHMEVFGGAGAGGGTGSGASDEDTALAQLLACVAQVCQGRSPTSAELEAILARASAALGEGTIEELGVALCMASGDFEQALDLWGLHEPSLAARDDRRALACKGLMHAYLGRVVDAEASARQLTSLARDASDARWVGELLEHLGRPAPAAEQLRVAATDAGDDASAYEAHLRLAWVAAQAGQRELALHATATMRELAQRPEQLLATAQMQREAGEFLLAEATLDELLRDNPGHREGALLLASSRLWRDDHEGAATLVRALLQASPDDVDALRTLGATEYLGGDPSTALTLLDRVQELAPGDNEGLLWRAEVLDNLGRQAAARTDVLAVGLGDLTVWQLLRARIKGHAAAGPEIIDKDRTWFIVDINIRQLLGDAVPPDTKVNWEVADEAITRAIKCFGGNRTERPTTPTPEGSLRWLDDVESPRRRAEKLQYQAGYWPAKEVIAKFMALATEHPQVPFFTTYAAEMWLWHGEFERSYQMFEQTWLETRTRWGYVGAGAAAMFLGRDDRAFELWEEGKEYYEYIPAEATYCFRGELHRRRGELEQAEADLLVAVEARPTRIGAWANLALLHHTLGREQPMREAVARVEAVCPPFAWLARRDAKLDAPSSELGPDALARYMSTLLELMQGNRSSGVLSIFDRSETLRVISVVPSQTWSDQARRSLALFEDELLLELARRRGL